MDSQGTPKTLRQAIRNGLEHHQVGLDAAAVTLPHVRDYLAQKFSVAVMQAPTVEEGERLIKLLDKIMEGS